MENVFPRGAERFELTLLELLSHGGGLSAAMRAEALASHVPGQPIERALLAAGLPASALLRGVIEAEAHYVAELGDLCFALGVLDIVPPLLAKEHRLVPLAARPHVILALTSPEVSPALRIEHQGISWDVVRVGTTEDVEAELEAVGTQLERLRSVHERLPDYLVRRGVLRHRHGGAEMKDPAYWAAQALQDGAAEADVYDAGAAFLDRPLLGLARAAALLEAPPRLDRAFAESEGMLVLRVIADHLLLLLSRIPDLATQEQLMLRFGCRSLAGYVMTPSELHQLIDRAYGGAPISAAAIGPEMELEVARDPEEELPTSIDLSRYPGVSSGLQSLLVRAIQRRASDIHIERYRQRVDVRFRIDGALHLVDAPWLTPQSAPAFLAKIKIESRLDIAERRRPQDGVIRRRLGERKIDIRVAIQPTLWGENAVLRVLDQGANIPSLDALGLDPEVLAVMRRMIHNPQGMILLTGPTGCGKTTTLYAVLQELLRDNLKIVTAEDPIEYAIDGVQQSQTNDAIGDTFDRYLRAFLRQDPDVILVGEIRDAVTAESAVRAAQTGHLVLSTLHVDDAQGAVRRLIDLGVTPALVSQTLLCVVSQRLARRVCRDCGRPDRPAAALLEELYPAGLPADAHLLRGPGCGACNRSGYHGRIGLVELWQLDRESRGMIERGATTAELIDQALATGMRSLVTDATDKAARGLTTLEELHGVLSYDQLTRHREAAFARARPRATKGGRAGGA